jgi:hypothetical protein
VSRSRIVFFAAPAPGENVDAAPILLYSKPKVFKGIKVNIRYDILWVLNTNRKNKKNYSTWAIFLKLLSITTKIIGAVDGAASRYGSCSSKTM